MTYAKASCGLKILVEMLSEAELLYPGFFFCVDNNFLGDDLVPSFVKKADFQNLLVSLGMPVVNATHAGYVFVYFGDDALMLTAIIIDSFKNYLDEGMHYVFNVQTGGSACYKMGLETWDVFEHDDMPVFVELLFYLIDNFLQRVPSQCNDELLEETRKRMIKAGLVEI